MHVQVKPVAPVVLIVLALSLPGCGEYPGVPRQVAAGSVPGVVGLPPAGEPAAAPGPASGRPAAAGNAAQIELRDFELVPSDLTVAAGEVTFTLVNAGRYTHDFRVEGQGLDEKSPRVSAGRTGEWRITLVPGAYKISCPVSNHADRGMTGTLTVIP